MTTTAYDLANATNELIAFSPVALRLCDIIDDEISNASNIANIIKQDPVLTAKLLQLANSPFYGYSQEISGIVDAINRLGTEEAFRIAISISISNSFKGIPESIISKQDFWSHSILCAYAAQDLAKSLHVEKSSGLYAAGLLHDIGQLVLFSQRMEESVEVLERCIGGYEELDQTTVEMEIFGFTHADVGFELSHLWNFPKLLQECIAYHHQPQNAYCFKNEVMIIGMSNVLAALIEIDSNHLDDVLPFNETIYQSFIKYSIDISKICNRIEQRYKKSNQVIMNSLE